MPKGGSGGGKPDRGGDSGTGEYTGSDGVIFINPSDIAGFDYHIIGTDDSGIRDTIVGGSGDDFIEGMAGRDDIDGMGGNDLIEGGAGHDSIHGGDGNDTLIGGSGSDTLYGDAGTDILMGGDDDDVLVFSLGDDTGTTVVEDGKTYKIYESDTYDGGLNSAFTGRISAGDSLYFSDENIDHMTIDFGGSSYTVYTLDADGNDAMVTGNFSNIEKVSGSGGNDVIYGSEGVDWILSGGFGDDLIDGRGGNDHLLGDNGNDTLIGGTGEDIIWGGHGNDIMIGGEGLTDINGDMIGDGEKDIFQIIGGKNENADIIMDFEKGTDKIGINNRHVDSFDDLKITLIDEDNDGIYDHTLIEFGKGTEDGSVLLLNITSVTGDDFIF